LQTITLLRCCLWKHLLYIHSVVNSLKVWYKKMILRRARNGGWCVPRAPRTPWDKREITCNEGTCIDTDQYVVCQTNRSCLKICWKNMVSSNNNIFVKCPKLFILHLHKFQFMHKLSACYYFSIVFWNCSNSVVFFFIGSQTVFFLQLFPSQIQSNHYTNFKYCFKGVGMIRVDFGPISETVYIDIILNTIIER
jgi:hypothetical protein